MKRFILPITLTVMLAAGMSFAVGIPKQMSYQGILAGPTGTPLEDSTVDVEFRIYNAAAGGSSVWIETQTVTTDGQGRFNVILGSFTPIEDTVFRQPERYLSINVESNGEIVPRTKLVSAGYSNRVSTIDGAKGGSVFGETVIVGSGPDDVIVLGVSDPNIALELRSGTFGGEPFIDFVNDAAEDNDARIQLKGEKGLEISVDSSLTIPTGKVGIGTTNPAAGVRLDVNGAIKGSTFTNGANPFITGNMVLQPAAGASLLVVPTTNSTTSFQVQNNLGLPLLNVDAVNGNVGIGTTSASQKLHVAGNAQVDDTLFASNVSSLSPLRLQTAGSTRMYIDDVTGNVGIGLTSTPARLTIRGATFTSATRSLDISDGGGLPVLTVRDDSRIGIKASSPEARLHIRSAGLGVSDRVLQVGTWTDDTAMVILGGGNVGFGFASPTHPLHMESGAHVTAGGTWTNASSRELKTDIVPLENEEYSDILKKLEELDVVHFKYKSEPDVEHIGMIAEDVPDEMASPDRKGIPTADAIAFLVAAVKAQQEKIAKLEKRLEEIEVK